MKGKTRHHYTDSSSPRSSASPTSASSAGAVCASVRNPGRCRHDFTHAGSTERSSASPLRWTLSETPCVNCGQCTLACPTGALREVRALERSDARRSRKEPDSTVVAQAAPAIRVTMGKTSGCRRAPRHRQTRGRAAALPASPGLRYRFAADLTIMEEGTDWCTASQQTRSCRCSPPVPRLGEVHRRLLSANSSTLHRKSPHEMMGAAEEL